VAGGAAEVLPVSLNCPLPLRRTHPPTLACCFCVFAAIVFAALACSLPIIPAWDFTLRKWIGDGDWRIALAMD